MTSFSSPRLERLLAPAALGCPGIVRHDTGHAGHSWSVLEGGTGPTLLLLHGGVAAGAASFFPVLAALAERWHVVAPDLPGCGMSEPAAGADHAGWLEAVLDQARPVAVVAASIGGALALHAWAREPQGRPPLVLVGAPGLAPFRPCAQARWWMTAFALFPSRLTLWALARATGARIQRSREMDCFAGAVIAGMRRRQGRQFLRTLRPYLEVVPQAVRLEGKICGLWGQRDPLVPLRDQPDWLRCWQVPDAAHYPFMDAPAAFLGQLDQVLAHALRGAAAERTA